MRRAHWGLTGPGVVVAWMLMRGGVQTAKALVVRAAPSTAVVLAAVVKLLTSPHADAAAAALETFALLLQDDVVGLAKEDHAIVKVRVAGTRLRCPCGLLMLRRATGNAPAGVAAGAVQAKDLCHRTAGVAGTMGGE